MVGASQLLQVVDIKLEVVESEGGMHLLEVLEVEHKGEARNANGPPRSALTI